MTVELDVRDGVATITLNDPARRNALDVQAARELVAHCERIEADLTIGAAVVRGAGGAFCSGATRDLLSRAGEDPAEPSRYESVGAVYDAFVRVGTLPVPTIAAVQGAAVGAGVNLMLATDLRIVAKDARILAGFARIGIHPGGGHFALLGRLGSREAAAAIGLFGEEVSGEQAQALRLAWSALPAEEVDAAAHALAARIAVDPSLTRRSVASFRGEIGPPAVPWAVAVDLERAPQMWSLSRRHHQATAPQSESSNETRETDNGK
jgi:enoyl-CoA hydratase